MGIQKRIGEQNNWAKKNYVQISVAQYCSLSMVQSECYNYVCVLAYNSMHILYVLQISYDNQPEWLQPCPLPVPSELAEWSTVAQVHCCVYVQVRMYRLAVSHVSSFSAS